MYQFIIDAAADDNTPPWFNELANCEMITPDDKARVHYAPWLLA